MNKHGKSAGVNAKETKVANIQLDCNTNTSSITSLPAEGSTQVDSYGQTTLPTLDGTGSYVQVLVQQHRSAPRLPAASSPVGQCGRSGAGDAGGAGTVAPVLSCPRAHSRHHSLPFYANECKVVRMADAATDTEPAHAVAAKYQKINKIPDLKILNNTATNKLDLSENGESPERVEVYYFDRGSGRYLATSGAGGRTASRVEEWGRRAGRAGAAALAEAAAAVQLLLAPTVALLVSVERCALTAARDLVSGAVLTVADFALKPALALAFNACAAPLLTCGGNVLHAVREALRPLWATCGDVLAPLAPLARTRLGLVHVHVDRRCACAHRSCRGI